MRHNDMLGDLVIAHCSFKKTNTQTKVTIQTLTG